MPRLCGFPATSCRRPRLSCQPHPLFELHLPLESYPATPTRPPQRSGPLMGFGSLQHIQGFEVHESRAMQAARSVPSSGFGYPLDGLRPRIPGRFYFAPAALMGFALRRFDLPESLTAFRLGEDPRTVSLAVAPAAKRRIGSTSRGFWVYSLRKRRLPRRGFRPTTTSSSLGILPSRAYPREP